MFNIKVSEITDNRPFVESDMTEMAFYVKQTFARYSKMIDSGYLVMEESFRQENDDTVTRQFDPNNEELLCYADSTLLTNLKDIYQFCFVETDKRKFFDAVAEGYGITMGGINDFLSETMSPCLCYQSLSENGVMEDYYDSSKIHRLFIAFFAQLKVVYGSLDEQLSSVPDMSHHLANIQALGVDLNHFSFREITMLSGYKTERAVRNLASPSTPAHRRISIIKEGRNTYVSHDEAVRWLSSNGKSM
ncbi:hypothetical protein DXV75_16740 [Alteromonas aestuariivivens]|uniref:DNA-binding protein n=1 Tax=Alteromonas aestuariivivens TaxID=1938339 RepID=A0A3D8M2X9_9ALTE|nr:hypothetical protein [Alteromonas aestuariivivens]RDV23915.1 hypothetical protein DXV75_16740 [Alteromonas aestuariivivens]